MGGGGFMMWGGVKGGDPGVCLKDPQQLDSHLLFHNRHVVSASHDAVTPTALLVTTCGTVVSAVIIVAP
jgi:hypothetical protein